MPGLEYYTSERFIWDGIIARAQAGFSGIYETWRTVGRIIPFTLSWPAQTLISQEGLTVEGVCTMKMPAEKRLWAPALAEFVMKTKAYALLLVDQKESHVSLDLESHHGVRSWQVPIRLSGDAKTLTWPREVSAQPIGILWSAKKNQA